MSQESRYEIKCALVGMGNAKVNLTSAIGYAKFDPELRSALVALAESLQTLEKNVTEKLKG